MLRLKPWRILWEPLAFSVHWKDVASMFFLTSVEDGNNNIGNSSKRDLTLLPTRVNGRQGKSSWFSLHLFISRLLLEDWCPKWRGGLCFNLEVCFLLVYKVNEVDNHRDGPWISRLRLGHRSMSGFSDAPHASELLLNQVLEEFYFWITIFFLITSILAFHVCTFPV